MQLGMRTIWLWKKLWYVNRFSFMFSYKHVMSASHLLIRSCSLFITFLLFQFQFVNSFLALFYTAFYLQDMDKLKEVRVHFRVCLKSFAPEKFWSPLKKRSTRVFCPQTSAERIFLALIINEYVLQNWKDFTWKAGMSISHFGISDYFARESVQLCIEASNFSTAHIAR